MREPENGNRVEDRAAPNKSRLVIVKLSFQTPDSNAPCKLSGAGIAIGGTRSRK